MKTIAVSIDEATLEAVERLTRRRGGGRPPKRPREGPTRSEIVRLALHEFLERRERREREAEERRILHRHRGLLARQARALVAEQAEP